MYTFHIVQGTRIQGGDTSDYKLTQSEIYSSASTAKVAILKQFLKVAPPGKTDFVKAPDAELINPDFAGLYSVPPIDMGWGFDALSFLPLHKIIINKNRLKHKFAYVERKEANPVTIE